MMEFLAMQYVWIKAFHVIFVIAWMAGLLMAPRLRIYQMSGVPGDALFDLMSEASARLRKIILTPALIVTWVLGLTMLWLQPSLITEFGWFHVKLALVLAMTGVHGWLIAIGKRVEAADPNISEKRLRLLNEVPFIIMIGVILLAIVKPF